MRNKANVINTIPPTTDYPYGRIKDDTGVNDGTPIVEANNGDIQETVTGLMERAKFTPNNLPDNKTNGYQIMDAIRENGGKFDMIHTMTLSGGELVVDFRLDNVYDKEYIIVKFMSANDTDNVIGVNELTDSNLNSYQAFLYPDFDNNFFSEGRYVIERNIDAFSIYPIATRSVLSNIYERLETLEISSNNNMRIIERGVFTMGASAVSGVVMIPHLSVDVANTRVIYTCTRANPMTSIISTNFSQLMLDRTSEYFRVVFDNFPTGSTNDKLKIEWFIVQA